MQIGKQLYAPKLKEAVELTFKKKFQAPALDEIFHELNHSLEETLRRRNDFETMLDHLNTFKAKKDSIDKIIAEMKAQNKFSFDWVTALEELQDQNVLKMEEFKSFIDDKCIQSVEPDSQSIINLKTVQFSLEYGNYSNLYEVEMALVKLQNFFKEKDAQKIYPGKVVKDFNESVIRFWTRQIRTNILDKIKDRFDWNKYEDWKNSVIGEINLLLESNLVIEKETYLHFVKLKLQQIIYFSLKQGKIQDLKTLKLHDEGDELERLKSVLRRLEVIDLGIPQNILTLTVADVSKFLQGLELLSSNHTSPDSLHTAFAYFTESFKEFIASAGNETEEELANFFQDIELRLVTEWEKVTGLAQLHDSHGAELNHDDVGKINRSIDELFMKNIKNKSKLSGRFKIIVHKCLGSVKSFGLQDFEKLSETFTNHLNKLKCTVEDTISELEEIIIDEERLSDMINKSIETKKMTVSCYIQAWENFDQPWNQIIAKERKYFRKILREVEAEAFVREDESDSEETGSGESGSDEQSQVFSTRKLLKKIEKNCSRFHDIDKAIMPAIKLTCELFAGLRKNNEVEMKFLLALISLGRVCSFPQFTQILKTYLDDEMNLVGIKEFCYENVTNSVRKLVVKFSKSDLSIGARIKILEAFMEPSESGGLINVGDFRTLLSKTEEYFFGKMVNNEESSFKIPSNLKTLTDWEVEFQHTYMQNLLRELVSDVEESKRRELSKMVDIWGQEVGKENGVEGLEKWMTFISKLAEDLLVLPIPFDDLSTLLSKCRQFPVPKLIQVVNQHVPQTLLKYILEAEIEELVSSQLNKWETSEVMKRLDLFIISEQQIVWEDFLKKILHEIPSLKSPERLKSLLIETIDPYKLHGSQRTSVISKWIRLPVAKWKQQLQTPIYAELIPAASDTLMSLLLEVDEKFSTKDATMFAKYYKEHKLGLNKLEDILGTIIKNDLMLDSTAVKKIMGEMDTSKIQEILENYKTVYDNTELKKTPLVDAIITKNKDDNIPSPEKQDKLRSQLTADLREISRLSKEPTKDNKKKINEWSTQDIMTWLKSLNDTTVSLNEPKVRQEMLAVISQGAKLIKGYCPRDAQLATILSFIYAANDGIGRFGEIATSEGKTLISAVLGITLALTRKNIYIISSSAVLAEDGFQNMKKLFDVFGVEVGNISDPDVRKGTPSSEKQLRKLYNMRVLYGDAGSFQADYLHCNHLGKDYKGGTDAGYLIEDEVDSMLLDKGTNVLYISHTIPELKFLRNIFLDIWTCVLKDVNKFAIYRYIMMKYIRVKRPAFSSFLKEFVEHRTPVWINNAFIAKDMRKNVPYILADGEEGKVTIVDNDTGVEQKQTQYSYGLHQFLQLKEGNKISSESLKAVFVSNVGYFSNFKGRIFGITGTLGESNAKRILQKVYEVDFIKMPRFRKRRCVQLPPNFFKKSEEIKYESAVLESIKKRGKEQPILFICENVKQCKDLNSKLKSLFIEDPDSLICIYESEEYDKFLKLMEKHKIKPGTVIISTNLAGRGTDINLSDECDDKGLHVVLLYIPPNVRVEKQAFGRTARAGQNGSTEYIVLLQDEIAINLESHFSEMLARESQRLEQVEKIQLPQIILEEELFKVFAKKMKQIKEKFDDKEKIRDAKIHIVKNRWAFWVDSVQSQLQMLHINEEGMREIIWQKFNNFSDELDSVTHSDATLCRSPSDFLKLAHAYEDEGKFEQSVSLLTKGIEQEPEYNEALHYYLGLCYLKQETKGGKANLELREKARKVLKKAMMKISSRKDKMTGAFTNFKSHLDQMTSPDFKPNLKDLGKQMETEVELLSHHEQMFLYPALGFEIQGNSFKVLKSVKQEEAESIEIFEALLNEKDLIKGLRTSKKFNLRKVELSGEPLDFNELGLSLFEDSLRGIFQEMTEQNEALSWRSRHFDQAALGKGVVSKDYIKEMIKEAKIEIYNEKTSKPEMLSWLEDANDYQILQIFYDDSRFTMEGISESFKQYLVTIGKILGENNLKSVYEPELENQLQDELDCSAAVAKELVQELLNKKYILKQNHFKGTIASNCHLKYFNKKLHGLPKSLLRYESVLTTWLVSPDSKICPQIDTKSLDLLLPVSVGDELTEREINDVISILEGAGVLKQPKVIWSLRTWFGKEENRKTEIENILGWSPETGESNLIGQLRKIFKKYHIKEFEENKQTTYLESTASFLGSVMEWKFETEFEKGFQKYLEEISNFLYDSVGKLKTIPTIKVDTSSLASCYTGQAIPEEYYALAEEGFDRVPVLKEKLPWWNTGAAIVAVLGVLQIAAGVAVAILSAGTLANVSMMLISEVGGDLIFAAHSAWQGSFSWKSYGIHKAFSVACSIATGGLGGITGGSWGTVILMEVGEEIWKKTLKTVGRYALQAVGTIVANMTIEKVLDWLRGKVMWRAKVAFQFWSQSYQVYMKAKERLRASLKSVLAASYRTNQLESAILNSKEALGPTGTSDTAHTFQVSMRRVAHFYMSKLTEKMSSALGQGILEKQGKENSTYRTVTEESKERSGALIETFMNTVDDQVVEAGLEKFQFEIAEPALKQLSAKWFDSKCSKGLAASLPGGSKASSSYMKQFNQMSVPATLSMNTRLGFDHENKARNNIWDTEIGQNIITRVQEADIQFVREKCSIAISSVGAATLNFVLSGAKPETVWRAERVGANFVRKIDF
ncbi:uncharacterized protein LOC118437603 [Folsomia candida]|uniref:uncharacterized protein LOC118437603 n=1 Tax=Folsomia candida TaxID=158441 RepID=UPI001604E246|nr:uncharacterized protein LOC118437603 [Folsomia candida]